MKSTLVYRFIYLIDSENQQLPDRFMKVKPLYLPLSILFLFCFISGDGISSDFKTEKLTIKPGVENYALGKYLSILEDKKGELSFADIVSGRFDMDFVPNEKSVPNMGYSGSVFWFKVTILSPISTSSSIQDWVVFYDNPYVSDLRLFTPDATGRYQEQKTGDIYPFSVRTVKNRKYAFKISIHPGESKTLFIRHLDQTMSVVPLSLMSLDAYVSYTQKDYLIYGMYFGVLLMLLLVNMILFAFVRDKHYLLYAGTLFFGIINLALMYGFLNQFIWPDAIHQMTRFSGLIISLAGNSGLLFGISFLNLQKDLPRIYKGLTALVLAWLGWAIISVYLPLSSSITNSLLSVSLVSVVLIILGIYQSLKGYKPAIYYLIATGTGLVAIIVSLLARKKILVIGLNPDDLVKFSHLFRVIVFSIAIEIKLRLIQKEKEAAEQLAVTNLHKADHLKDLFLANTSHELRTPLHGMIGIAESMMRDRQLPKEANEDLALITSSGRQLASLINDILDMTRIRANDLDLVIKPVDLFSATAFTLRLVQPLIEEKELEFVNLINPKAQYIDADENRLKQILNNLLGNAAKFTESGHIKIEAVKQGSEFKKEGDSKEYLEIRISDTGIGIPEEQLTRIFDLFEQGDETHSRTHQGSGLGLTITKKLVILQGGEIWAESVPGKGSCFIFTLPVSQLQPKQQIATQINTSPDRDVMRHHASTSTTIDPGLKHEETIEQLEGSPSILLVDDDPINIKILHRFLTKQQCNFETAWNGISALDKIKSGKFDLILLDIMMPRMSGYEVCRRIRESYTSQQLPVIMLTAKIHLSEVDEGFKAGANDYIQKPFILNELVRRINTTLKLKIQDQKPFFTLGKKGKNHLFTTNEVKYLSSAGKHAVVHTIEKEQEIPFMFKDIEKKLPPSFKRIHRQYIVNIDFIANFSHLSGGRYQVILNDQAQTELVVTRSYVSSLREAVDL